MKSFVRLRKSAKHVDNDFNSIILDAMHKEHAAFDLSLASTDEHGNFIANNFEKAVDAE